jgi:hypothetical protein
MTLHRPRSYFHGSCSSRFPLGALFGRRKARPGTRSEMTPEQILEESSKKHDKPPLPTLQAAIESVAAKTSV